MPQKTKVWRGFVDLGCVCTCGRICEDIVEKRESGIEVYTTPCSTQFKQRCLRTGLLQGVCKPSLSSGSASDMRRKACKVRGV